MDVFAVSLGISVGKKGLTRLQTARLALAFGFFQFLMPLLGWLAGSKLLPFIQAVDHWAAFGLLCLVGGRMIGGAFKEREGTSEDEADPTAGGNLFLLSLATSIDALALGLSFALLEQSIFLPAMVIGLVAGVMTALGARLGRILGPIFGKWAEFSGGLVLLLIGMKILLEHLNS